MGSERAMTNETKKASGSPAAGPLGPGQRWSVARKREVVLRMLKGESLDALSRELGIELHKLEGWRDRAVTAMEVDPGSIAAIDDGPDADVPCAARGRASRR